MQKYEIVCVDDERDLLDVYEVELETLNAKVVTFVSALEAIEYIKINHTSIACVLSDYRMPEMNGLEFRKTLLEEGIQTPFFMVTGFYSKEMAKEGMELKVSSFIEKPFDSDSLVPQIEPEIKEYVQTLEEENDMIKSFVEESYPMIEEIEELILVLESDPHSVATLNTYFRLLHTIKGTASCVGLKSLPDFTHHYEDLVTSLKDNKLQVNSQIIDILLKGLDVLKEMYTSIANDGPKEFEIEEKLKIFDLNNVSAKTEEAVEKKDVVEEKKKVEDEKINVQVSLLDEFMELSGEITVLRNLVLKSVLKVESRYQGDRDIDVLSETLDEMHKVSSLLQGQISEMRKVSLDAVYRPIKRVVRDASKKLNKKVNLSLDGADLRVDTVIGKVLNNVLVHLIRNGLDHGLETPEKRLELGKDETGHISLKTEIDTDNIIVTISDDGNGINKDILSQKAIEKGLYTEEQISKMNDQRIFSFIFESGFSTAQEVTDISGRGVGMDMVRSSVEDIGGKILIDSKVGTGTTFVLVLPIPRSVLIIKALMVSSANQQFAVPLDDIGEVLNFHDAESKEMIHELEGTKVLKHSNGEIIPLINLSNECEIFDDNYLASNILIIRGEGFTYGLLVDEIFDIEEIVVKKMASQLQTDDTIFTGATFIGDGEMALILDLEKIAQKSDIELSANDDYSYIEKETVDNLISLGTEYLQFSVGLKNTFCLELKDVDRLEEFRSSQVNYTGNVPVVRYRENFLPLINIDSMLHGNISNFDENFKVLVVDKENKKYGFIVKEINDICETENQVDNTIACMNGIKGTIYLNERTITMIDVEYFVKNYKEYYLDNSRDEILTAA